MEISRDKARDMVQTLIDLCNKIDCSDRRAVDSLREKAANSAKQIFGEGTVYAKVMRDVKFHPESMTNMANTSLEMNKARAIGVGKLASILREMLMEIITGH